MRSHCFCILVCFTGLVNSLFGQAYPYIIQRYTSENGLPQNSVKSIQFDNDGFCWLATEAGLVRFDNRDFKVFGHDNIQGLRSERIFVMSADTNRNIYAQNINNQDMLITPVGSLKATAPSLVKNELFYYPAMGYLSTNTSIGYLWDSLAKRDAYPVIHAFTSLRNGEIYILHEKKLFYINGSKIRFLSEGQNVPFATAPLGDRYFMQFWNGNKIIVWKHGLQQPETHLEGDIINDEFFTSGNSNLLWCPNGTFIYAKGRLYQISVSNGRAYGNLVLENLPIDQPLCIYFDSALATYYIGSATQGLFVIKLADFIYPDMPASVVPYNFYTVVKTSDDKIITKNVVVDRNKKPYYVSLDNKNCVAAYVDNKDRMYYEREYTLCRFDTKTNKISEILTLNDRMVAIMPDSSEKNLLICTHRSILLLSYNDSVIWKKDLPTGNIATGLYKLRDNYFLLLTTQGLKWYDLTTNSISHSILDSFYIRSVYPDKSNRLWISTDGNGAFLYQNRRLYSLPLGPSKSFKTIHSFIDDGKGYFWLPTNNGLFRVPVRDLADYVSGKRSSIYFYVLDKKNGLRTNEFNGGCNPAYQWLSDSTLVLPSLDGLAEFKPDKLPILYPENKIFIDDMELDEKALALSDPEKAIELPPDFRIMSMKVSCPYFGNIENLQLEYALDNAGKLQWLPIPANGQININTLPSGHYRIIIRKAGGPDGQLSAITVKIIVLKRFYNTWWFYLLSLLLIACIVYWLNKNRIRKLRLENEKIEQLVSLRTQELNYTVAKLENSEMALKKSNIVKEQVIAMVLHDLRSPIRFLGTIGNYIIKNYKDLDRPALLSRIRDLNSTINSLRGFTEQFFSWAISQREDFKVNKCSFPLQEVFDDVASLYEDIVSHSNNELKIQDTQIICFSDKYILLQIIRNMVDNANKNMKHGIVQISADKTGDLIRIFVKDTGRGMSKEQVDYFMNVSKGMNENGAGSTVILNMIAIIGAGLDINTEPGKGSVFIISFK